MNFITLTTFKNQTILLTFSSPKPMDGQRATWMINRKKLTIMDEAVAQTLTEDQTKLDTDNKAVLTWSY